jgi:hypothetical protein
MARFSTPMHEWWGRCCKFIEENALEVKNLD